MKYNKEMVLLREITNPLELANRDGVRKHTEREEIFYTVFES